MNPRVAFLASRGFEFQIPESGTWDDSALFPVAEDWEPAIANAKEFRPDVTFLFDPFSVPGPLVDVTPGIKVGIVSNQPTKAELNDALLRQRGGAGALDWFTWVGEPTAEANELPLLAVVAALVDTRRLPFPPKLDRSEVAMPSWARPPDLPISAKSLQADADWVKLREALATSGILLYYAPEPLQLGDPALVLALGLGLLLISNQAFVADCGLEAEDDYLIRPVREWPKVIEKEKEGLGAFRSVRIRASQKVRELFDASVVFRRLAQDAILLKDAGKTLPTRRRW